MSTTVTASTSVILAPTRTTPGNYIVYFPNISTNGRLITVRDNDGFASTNHTVVLSTLQGVTFGTGTPQITINQPFGFITLNSQSSGNYTVLNTFAFPEGSAAAYVNQVTTSNLITSTIQSLDIGTQSTNTIYTSSGSVYVNNNVLGEVTTQQLTSTVAGLGSAGYISSINVPLITPALYLITGQTSNQLQNSNTTSATGSVVYGDGTAPYSWINATNGISQGFSNGGYDVVVGNLYAVACGDSFSASSNNTYIQYSIDGCNWNYTNTSLSSFNMRLALSYANGLYHAVGSNGASGGAGTILWSSDVVNWNDSQTSGGASITPFPSGYARGIAYGYGRWVVAGTQLSGNPANSLPNSSNGSNWLAPSVAAWSSEVIWDVAFNGSNFMALAAVNSVGGNIVKSTDGVSWSLPAAPGATTNLRNGVTGGGYIAGNDQIWIVTGSNGSPTGQMMWYSLNNGDSWTTNGSFATGQLSRPHWDGSQWWVGYYNPASPASQGIYYSVDGISWQNTGMSGGFVGGLPRGFATRNAQSNYSVALLSTVAGLQTSFTTLYLGANTISTNSITAATESVSSLYVNVISSGTQYNAQSLISSLQTTNISAATESVNNLFVNTVSTNSIQAATMIVSSLYVNVQIISTIFETVDNISTMNANFVSAGTAQIRTAQFSSLQTNVHSTNLVFASNVGIGTTAPITPLHVQAALPLAEPYAHILLEGTNPTTPNSAIAFSNATGWARIGVAGNTNQYATGSVIGDLVVTTQTANKKMLFVNYSGTGLCLSNNCLGIGKTNPTYNLDVTSSSRVTFSNTNTYTTAINLQFSNQAAYPVASRQMTSEIQLGSLAVGNCNYNTAIRSLQTNFADTIDLGFFTNQTTNNCNLVERMTIQSRTGFVGINNTTPSRELDVRGQIRATAGVSFYSTLTLGGFTTASVGGLIIDYTNTDTNITSGIGSSLLGNKLNIGSYAGVQTMTIDTQNSNVGIRDTTPSFPLDVNGVINTNSPSNYKFTADSNNTSLFLLRCIPLAFFIQTAGGQQNLYYPPLTYTGSTTKLQSVGASFLGNITLAPRVSIQLSNSGGINSYSNTSYDLWDSYSISAVGYDGYRLYFI